MIKKNNEADCAGAGAQNPGCYLHAAKPLGAAAKPAEKLRGKTELPGAMRKRIRIVREGLEDVVRRMFGVENATYSRREFRTYLKSGARSDLERCQHLVNHEPNFKIKWGHEVHIFMLMAEIEGEERLQQAETEAALGNLDASNLKICEASVYFGRLTMLLDLQERGVLHDIGMIDSAFHAGQRGGIRSGEARRSQKLVPSPAALAKEKVALLESGRSPRDIAAVLAKRYGCTCDHIRKELKKQD